MPRELLEAMPTIVLLSLKDHDFNRLAKAEDKEEVLREILVRLVQARS